MAKSKKYLVVGEIALANSPRPGSLVVVRIKIFGRSNSLLSMWQYYHLLDMFSFDRLNTFDRTKR
jgi:hypothetical protein